MKNRPSLLEFQFENTIVIDDDYPFRLVLEDQERAKLYEAHKKEAEDLIFTGVFDRLAQDIYFSFYNKHLELRPKDFIKLRFLMNRVIMENLLQEEAHKSFRTGGHSTVHNKIASHEAFLVFVNKVLENVKKYLSEKEQQDYDKLLDKSQALQDKNEGLQKKEGLNAKEMKKLRQELSKAEKELEKDVQAYLQKTQDKLKRITKDAVENSKRDIAEADSALQRMFGGPFRGYQKGELQQIPIHQRIELAKKLRNLKNLQQLIDYVGKFRIIAQMKQIEKLSNTPQEVADVKKGGDLENILHEELQNLGGNETTKADFLQRWSQEELYEFERKPKKEKQNLGKGSIIICVDTSGSMRGEKEYKSKALALSIADVAYAQKRNFACILFSSKWETEVVKIQPQEKLDVTSPKVITIATNFYDGGTDFESPLQRALEIIDEDEFNNGDIIFLTDGYADVSEAFLQKYQETKRRKQFKTIGLLCDSSDSDRENGRKILNKFCDELKFNSDIEADTNFNMADDFANDLFLSL